MATLTESQLKSYYTYHLSGNETTTLLGVATPLSGYVVGTVGYTEFDTFDFFHEHGRYIRFYMGSTTVMSVEYDPNIMNDCVIVTKYSLEEIAQKMHEADTTNSYDYCLTELKEFFVVDAEPVPTNAVTIQYNGSVIASLESGQTATLNCAGKKMATDISITAPEVEKANLQEKSITENGEVTPDEGYDGFSKVIVDVPIPDGYIVPTGTKEITENGIYDVTEFANTNVNIPIPVVEMYDGTVTYSGGDNLISFTIDGTSYKAEEGMTWGDWVDSSFNTNGYSYLTNGDVYRGTAHYGYAYWITTDGTGSTKVSANETIVTGAYKEYQTFSSGGAE